MDDLVYYIWLSLRVGAGSEAPSFLLSHFGSPKSIYDADEKTLTEVLAGRRGLVESLCDKDLSVAQRVLEYCARTNVGIITLDSEIYPERLRSIHAKPIVLYYKGKLPKIDEHVLIGCVGTRTCSEKGAKNAYKLGEDLAKAGVIVVSGMARGIDTMCARGALSAGGYTIAVLGCGIDRAYPAENRGLMDDIIENGAVITEYAPGMSPNGKHFPVRNRIISGLSLGTVVVEADMGSGSLITAEHARKQGRDVFAFPGDIDNLYYKGTNELIANGAVMVRCAADILAEYGGVWYKRIYKPADISKKKKIKKMDHEDFSKTVKNPELADISYTKASKKRTEDRSRQTEDSKSYTKPLAENTVYEEVILPEYNDECGVPEDISGLEKSVYEVLDGALTADEITVAVRRKTGEGTDTGDVLCALTSLEIYGYCESLPGGLFKKK